jgi:hypothetical protein
VIGVAASQLIIHDIVGPERLPSAIRLNATSRDLAILLGPAVGGGRPASASPTSRVCSPRRAPTRASS